MSHEDSVREHLHPAHKWVGGGGGDDDDDDDGGGDDGDGDDDGGGGDDDGDAYKFRPSKLNFKLKRKAPPWKITINFKQWDTYILYKFLH